ncbi:DUF839 domain-containing protein [Pendulispora brunnea]|uniref:DUF839 domain-containing protein n=1 Tax=Pendulispora brunnea TaxID=2905690 RepID=A0ABZ2KMG3_9BACT
MIPSSRRVARVRALSVTVCTAVGVAMLVAACGDDGSTGAPGQNGANGANGEAGAPGQNGNNGQPGKGAGALLFSEVQTATTDTDKRAVLGIKSAKVNGADVNIGYHTELRSRAALGSGVYGRLVAKDGTPLTNADHSEVISPSNDFSSILPVGDKLWEITHFETVPAAMYLTELKQGTDGNLTAVSTKPVDFAGVDGLWTPCAGSVSPWGTHLGSEEYPPDARPIETAATIADFKNDEIKEMLRYWKVDASTASADEARKVFHPYNYGYAVEIAVDAAGATTVKKHPAMGRRALELAYVMPDKKTVYLTDDGTNDVFSMFIADKPGDLSAGTLYAAQWFQTSPAGAPHGTAEIFWVDLGHATDAELLPLVATTKFSDLFEVAAPNAAAPFCPDGFTSVNTDSVAALECLKLKPGKEMLASRFETRRYAAYKGATTEFRKNEGMTFDPDTHTLFVSYSELNKGTEDGSSNDRGGPNHIKLARNDCGAVFALDVGPDSVLASDYVVHSASAFIEGISLKAAGATPYPPGSPYFGNTCAASGIANPDNLTFLPGYNTLIVGEDSGDGHQNDVAWAYNTNTRTLTRIFSTPYGSETTGAYWFPNVNGYGYLKMQVQHPYGESDKDKVPANSPERESYTGYIGPFPALTR